MVNSKVKGNKWENKLSNWLTDNGIKTWKDAQSGGGNREKGDIGNNIGLTIESKSAKNIKLMEWWKQVDKSARQQANIPTLFIHQDGFPDNEWLVVMHSNDWIEMVLGNETVTPEIDNKKLEWALKTLKDAISKVLKEL